MTPEHNRTFTRYYTLRLWIYSRKRFLRIFSKSQNNIDYMSRGICKCKFYVNVVRYILDCNCYFYMYKCIEEIMCDLLCINMVFRKRNCVEGSHESFRGQKNNGGRRGRHMWIINHNYMRYWCLLRMFVACEYIIQWYDTLASFTNNLELGYSLSA